MLSRLSAAVGLSKADPPPEVRSREPVGDFAQVYDDLFPFVWRTLRRLGVEDSAQDDACQEVFVVVHRRLADFRGESSLRTWVFGIASHVARGHRRTQMRKDPATRSLGPLINPDDLPATHADPLERAVRAERAQVAEQLLNSLDEQKRLLIIMADLEELPVPEIAQLTNANLNTTYARLKAARKAFSEAVQRYHARLPGARE